MFFVVLILITFATGGGALWGASSMQAFHIRLLLYIGFCTLCSHPGGSSSSQHRV